MAFDFRKMIAEGLKSRNDWQDTEQADFQITMDTEPRKAFKAMVEKMAVEEDGGATGVASVETPEAKRKRQLANIKGKMSKKGVSPHPDGEGLDENIGEQFRAAQAALAKRGVELTYQGNLFTVVGDSGPENAITTKDLSAAIEAGKRMGRSTKWKISRDREYMGDAAPVKETGGGYVPCDCRDCMEIAISDSGEPAMCHGCHEAGCDGDAECAAEGAYGDRPSDEDERYPEPPSVGRSKRPFEDLEVEAQTVHESQREDFRYAKKLLSKIDIDLTYIPDSDEFRVVPIDGGEAEAYYTMDLRDAFSTGKEMAKHARDRFAQAGKTARSIERPAAPPDDQPLEAIVEDSDEDENTDDEPTAGYGMPDKGDKPDELTEPFGGPKGSKKKVNEENEFQHAVKALARNGIALRFDPIIGSYTVGRRDGKGEDYTSDDLYDAVKVAQKMIPKRPPAAPAPEKTGRSRGKNPKKISMGAEYYVVDVEGRWVAKTKDLDMANFLKKKYGRGYRIKEISKAMMDDSLGDTKKKVTEAARKDGQDKSYQEAFYAAVDVLRNGEVPFEGDPYKVHSELIAYFHDGHFGKYFDQESDLPPRWIEDAISDAIANYQENPIRNQEEAEEIPPVRYNPKRGQMEPGKYVAPSAEPGAPPVQYDPRDVKWGDLQRDKMFREDDDDDDYLAGLDDLLAGDEPETDSVDRLAGNLEPDDAIPLPKVALDKTIGDEGSKGGIDDGEFWARHMAKAGKNLDKEAVLMAAKRYGGGQDKAYLQGFIRAASRILGVS